jgi:hypothetical protein
MILRLSKISLLVAVALYSLVVAFNNLTDYNSNYQFVHHVLLMDSTFPGNHGLWRALPQPGVQTVFYWSIIAWESTTCVLCCVGSLRLIRAIKAPATGLPAMVRGVPHGRRRVVPDVAVAHVERSGRGLPDVREPRNHSRLPEPARTRLEVTLTAAKNLSR